MGGWPRLRRSPIGLLPVGSQPLTIDRDRLERAILDAEATPLAIDWYGPRKIEVSYLQAEHDGASEIAQVSHQEQVDRLGAGSADPSGTTTTETTRRVDLDRMVQWIQIALDRTDPELATEFQVKIPQDQPNLAELADLIGVTEIASLGTMDAGRGRFRITGRSKQGPLEAEIVLLLIPHPKVAVPRRALPRGHRISAGDLEMQPLPEEKVTPDHIMDAAEVIGMEVHGTAPARRPLIRSSLGAPTLIRRGDLIEVRVVGGGVSVTTHAKSLDDGAAGDLLEVESLDPRKRLLARVVEPGLVEIITRAPKVRP
jgi:flagella basal body P-ring formation protein FlgA